MDRLRIAIANYLHHRDKRSGFYVNWRIYHGWHTGKTKTADRIAIETYVADAKSHLIANVAFGADFHFGNDLLCQTKRNPLYDTLRTDSVGASRQKMVDTALACDLLHSVRSRSAAISIIVGEDDDLLPALFTAEAWGGEVALLQRRQDTNKFLNTRGLIHQMDES